MGAPLKLGVGGGGLFLFGAVFGFWGFDAFLNSQIAKSVQLTKGNDMRNNWGKMPFPLDFKIYLFNLTNAEDVANGEKPVVKEIGPYFFEEWKEKGNFEDNSTDDTVSFNMKTTWIFRKDRSGGLSGDEIVTIPNPVIFSMVMTVERDKPGALPMLAKALPVLFNNPPIPFVSARAMDIMFDGIPINCSSTEFGPKAVCSLINANPKGLVKISPQLFLFSFFGPKNATFEDGKFTVKRGVHDAKEVGLVVKYNGKSTMDVWGDDDCNALQGTDSTIFPPFIKDSDDIVSFSPDICRAIAAKFRSKAVFNSITGNRYTADLGDMSTNADEKCYCTTPTTCLKKGAFDITKCAGAPIILTLPHYYNADPSYLNEVDGLFPDEEKHQIALIFEPITGTPLNVRKRLQFNFKSHPVKKVPLMKGLTTYMIPTFWIEEAVDLPQEFVDLLQANLFRTMKIVGISKWVIMVIGLGLAGIGVYLNFKRSENPAATDKAKSKAVQVESISGKY